MTSPNRALCRYLRMKSGALCVGMKRLEGLGAGKNWLPIPKDKKKLRKRKTAVKPKKRFGSSGLDLACPASHGTFRTTPDTPSPKPLPEAKIQDFTGCGRFCGLRIWLGWHAMSFFFGFFFM